MLMHGEQSQTNLPDTICDPKSEIQANAASPAEAGEKNEKIGAGLQVINNHFQIYESVNSSVPALQHQSPISTPYNCTI